MKKKATQPPKSEEGVSEAIRLLLLAAEREEAKIKYLKYAVISGDLALVYLAAADLVGVEPALEDIIKKGKP